MISAKVPKNEEQRLQALYQLKILDTEMEKCFDEITSLIAQICEVPISLITLIDKDRQWFKSKYGTDLTETSRDIAFCPHVIIQDGVMEVADSRQDKRFFDNPLVTGKESIIFYAGAPLRTPDGHGLGALCVIDNKPNKLNDMQRESLRVLSLQVSNQLELRRIMFDLVKAQSSRNALAMAVTYNHKINGQIMILKGTLTLVKRVLDPKNYKVMNDAIDKISAVMKHVRATLEGEDIEFEKYSDEFEMLKMTTDNE